MIELVQIADDFITNPIESSPEDDEALRQIKHAERVHSKARELRVLEEARRLLARQARGDRPMPRPVGLADFLAEPDTDAAYRVDGLLPLGGRVVLAAPAKGGKTSVVANLTRSLADGEPFLGRFDVVRAEKVVLIDDELDPRTLRRWLREQAVENTEAVQLVSLRGDVGAFDLLDDGVRREWATMLAGVDVLILDCLRPVLDALGLDENHEAGRFLVALDALLADLGNADLLLVHHMGHGAERSRGDSRLLDWPDATWRIVRDKDEDDPNLDDLSGSRYFSAFGRDVDLPQSELTYDPDSRRLTIGDAAPNRRQATLTRRVAKAEQAVLAAVEATPGLSKTKLRAACGDHGATHHADIDAAVDKLVEDGLIVLRKQGVAHLHYLADTSADGLMPTPPNPAQGTVGTTLPTCPTSRAGLIAPPEDTEPPPTRVGHDAGTKPCPTCGEPIAPHLARCVDCALRLAADVRSEQAAS